jgi:eukaryotic-like serine/threonine-protein kinase
LSAERDPFEELIERVSDGGAVDWDQARTEHAEPADRERVEALSEVARIADFSRRVQRDPSETGSAPQDWGPLMLLERIGAGASGVVWRAWDPQLRRELAVKMLRSDAAAASGTSSLIAEGRALAQVRHPNVVMVHGLEEHGGRLGLRMELVRGVTLDDEIARRGALPVAEVESLARDLFAALAAVHAAGVLHRDVKPANLVRDPSGRWVLTDFGLGLKRALVGDGFTRTSGTPMFMPPECLDGAPATERADVYAAGATLWWTLTGRPPFESRTLEELRVLARRGPDAAVIERRSDVPEPLRAGILSALAPSPATPPVGAARILASWTTAPAGGATPNRAPIAWLAAAVVLAVVTAIVFLSPRHPFAPRKSATPSTAVAGASEPSVYSIEATLLRHGPDGPRPLATGDRVQPGDRLSLDVHSSQPVWVYVLDGDERGQTYLLFPQPLFDRGNPIAPDSVVRLPGNMGGRESAWTVTSRGGREHVLIVASPHPVPELESALASLPAPRPDRPVDYARIESGQLERLRGVGGVSPLPADPRAGPAPLFERIRALAGRESDVRGTWVRQVTLENPLR